ncbi:hypothetical protein [Vibrio sp. 10N.261.54.E10]|uniref:hypothetical protein n=1 Tax=Vibrio sp. 10N.261.54.E10 TaxID=1884475 RepID=UPI0039A65FED
MKTEFTQQDVAKLHFSHRVLYQGVSNVKEEVDSLQRPSLACDDGSIIRCRGSLDPRYAGKSWLALFPCIDALGGLKRGHQYARKLQQSPLYYLPEHEKRNVSFRNIDGGLYINDGHHRTIIGRVFLEANGFEPVFHNVVVGHYTGGLKSIDLQILPRRLKRQGIGVSIAVIDW